MFNKISPKNSKKISLLQKGFNENKLLEIPGRLSPFPRHFTSAVM